MNDEDAYKTIHIIDDKGLVTRRWNKIDMRLLPFASTELELDGISILESITWIKPNILIGLTGVGNLFTPEVLQEMKK